MSGERRARYLWDGMLEGDNGMTLEPFVDFADWQVIVDITTGVAYTLAIKGGDTIPRWDVARMIDDGFRP